MRYTLVFHEVRQRFGLTIAEYMVCDSISQLSRITGGCTKSSKQLSEFMGFDERSVRRAKVTLIEKGLIDPVINGYKTTDEWEKAVVADKMSDDSGQNVRKSGQNVRHTIYNTSNNISEAKASQVAKGYVMGGITIMEDEDKPQRQKKDTTYKQIFKLWGADPRNWDMNRTEIAAAQNILTERTIHKAQAALLFYNTNKDEPHCPQILKPSDLDRKWVNLIAFRDKR